MESMDSILSKINKITDLSARCSRTDLKVACIMDPFSYECFKFECRLEQLGLATWKQQMDVMKPELLLVESAWIGLNREWNEQVVDLDKRTNPVLHELIHYCREKHLPAVFWNKEDPLYYPRFIHAAKLFDFIFTTDANCIEQYKHDTGHDRVYCLPFAAQPALHHPIDLYVQDKGNVAYSGSWYHGFTERNEKLNTLLHSAIDFGLTIFDRKATKKNQFPTEFEAYIVGTLSYLQMVKAYKLYKVFLNVSTITESPTMFARRVFELLACGTNVISFYAKGIEQLFNEVVLISRSKEETAEHLKKLLRDPECSRRLSVLGIREVYSKHLYKHRFNYILEKIGISRISGATKGVSVITCLENMENLNNVMENYGRQLWDKKELILLADESLELLLLKEKTSKLENVSIYPLPKMPFGDIIKYAADKANYDYISLFGPVHYYAPHFLTDLMHSLQYSNAEAAGKGTYYVHTGTDAEVCFTGREHRFVDELCTSAMVVKKDVLTQISFDGQSANEEKLFFEKCANQGFSMYSADRYNFLYLPKDLGFPCKQLMNLLDHRSLSFVTV